MLIFNPQWQWKNWQTAITVLTCLMALPLGILSLVSPENPLIMVFAVLAVVALVIVVYSLAKGDDITKGIEEKILKDPLLKFCYAGNLEGIKSLNKSEAELKLTYPRHEDPVSLASIQGHTKVVEYLLQQGAPSNIKFKNEARPAVLAMRMGHVETFQTLQKLAPLSKEEFEEAGISEFMIECFTGNELKVLSQKKEFLMNQKDQKNITALGYAMLGAGTPNIVLHLLSLNSDMNISGHVYAKGPYEGANLPVKFYCPLHHAFSKMPEEIIMTMLKKENTYRIDDNGVTVLMLSVNAGFGDAIKYLAEGLDVTQKDRKGLDAIDYARAANRLDIEKYLRAIVDFKKQIQKDQEAKQRSKDIANGAVAADPNVAAKMEFEDIQLVLQLVTKGLVGMDHFISNFSHELKTFMDQKGGSKGIVLWGGASVGKTELSRRVCGLKENFQKLNLPGLKFKYIACCDDTVDVKQIIESVENKTVIFLDEIDKYLSPSAGLVSESQAKGLRTSLVTNFERKEVFWIFTGTFADIRGNSKLTRSTLEKTLGAELASRLDFSDWMLNDWTIESLLKAAQNALSRDTHIDYEDKALENLVKHVLTHNAGVRGLEKAHESIKRANRTQIVPDSQFVITENHVRDYIAKES